MSWVQGAAAAYSAVSGYRKSRGAASQLDQQAGYERQEGAIARAQANAAEGDVRRNSREALGRQIAAFGSAGVQGGASSMGVEQQSAVNQELDALRTRYKGALVGYGYDTQAMLDEQAARKERSGAWRTAAGALLKGIASSYAGGGQVKPGGSGWGGVNWQSVDSANANAVPSGINA